MPDPPAGADRPLNATDRKRESGRALRKDLPRSAHGELDLPADRDPLATIAATEVGRLPDLVPLRRERMAESPFAYFRGTADVMAADMSAGPTTGLTLVVNGDAHVSNFGLYATPERRLVFDLNDFDESGLGAWEWDVKRLAVSLELVLRERGVDAEERTAAVTECVAGYRDGLATLVARGVLERHYFSVDADWLIESATGAESKLVDRSVRKARRRTSEQVLAKITTTGPAGDRSIVAEPPILVPYPQSRLDEVRADLERYVATLRVDRALLIGQFRPVDVARRVVGVGSVGTRCSIVLLEGPAGEPLVMQVKEAGPGVLTPYRSGGINPDAAEEGRAIAGGQGRRVVACQQILQSASDPLLGWTHDPETERSYYWRQFRDMKGGLDTERMDTAGVVRYGRLCAALLARAHAQSPEVGAVAGYVGTGEVFCSAVARWAGAYADVVHDDHERFVAAVDGAGAGVTQPAR